MGTPSLSILPGELVVIVFQQLDSSATLLALARTSSHFWSIWESEYFYITQALFPRLIICFDDAEQLADAQQRRLTCLNLPQEIALDRVKRIFLNARSVQVMCDHFTSSVMTKGFVSEKKVPYLTSDERTRFTHAFYNVWTLVCISKSSKTREESRDFLATKDLREMYRLGEIGLWLRKLFYSQINHRPALTSAAEKFPSGVDEYLRLSAWDWTRSELHRAWARRMFNSAGTCHTRKPPAAPNGMFAIFDMWQNYVDLIPVE